MNQMSQIHLEQGVKHMSFAKKTPTKQKILEILKRKNQCSIKQLMVFFSISEIAVRKHLGELEKQGFIQKEMIKQDIGRPYYLFQLTNKGHSTFPDQYEELLLEFLDDLASMKGQEAVNEVLAKRMEREKEKYVAEIRETEFQQRVDQFVQMQNKAGFILESKELANGDYELNNYHCPIVNIAEKHRQLCRNEKQVMSDLFPGSRIQPKSCQAGEAHYCQWHISKPGK